jgi:integrase
MRGVRWQFHCRHRFVASSGGLRAIRPTFASNGDLNLKDVDLERRQITIRQGKGDLDRVTVLPEALVEKLKGHLEKVRRVHEADQTICSANNLLLSGMQVFV